MPLTRPRVRRAASALGAAVLLVLLVPAPPPAGGAAAPPGDVLAFGAADRGSTASRAIGSPTVGIAAHPRGDGYWQVTAGGEVFAFGAAAHAGSTEGMRLARPVVGIAADPDGTGYWLAAEDGGVFSFQARFAGSAGAIRLNAPVTAIAAHPSGLGYWLAAADGGVFSYGSAPFAGSGAGRGLRGRVVGIAATKTGNGYWLATSAGEVLAFGDASLAGSAAGLPLAAPVVGIAADPDGTGYWLAAADGGVFAFDAPFRGGAAGMDLAGRPVAGIAADPSSGGYWLVRRRAAGAGTGSCGMPVFPVDQLRPGMVATGRTVSSGTTVEPFTVEIVGTIPDAILPGVDLIVVKADSPAIRRAGGIWAGMSGSPVYAADGRLIGAVAYGMSWEPNEYGGVTPAAAMLSLLDLPAPAPGAPAAVPLPAAVRQSLLADGVSAAAAAEGMVPLAPPVLVSGGGPDAVPTMRTHLEKAGFRTGAVYRGSPAPLVAATAALQPGSHVGVALSYGDATLAATGTVTAVCDGRALVFGHPFSLRGSIAASAHAAEVLYVQPDELGVPYAVSRLGGTIGRADEDRVPGVRLQLGPPPPATRAVTRATDLTTGVERVGTTMVNDLFGDLAYGVVNHVYGTLIAAAGQTGDADIELAWTAKGTTAAGPWTLERADRYAGRSWVLNDLAWELYDTLFTLTDNPFAEVRLGSVDVVAKVQERYRAYRLGEVTVDDGSGPQPMTGWGELYVSPGSTLRVRATLLPYGGGPARTVELPVQVPADAAGLAGSLDVFGGRGWDPGETSPEGFADLLDAIAGAARNDHVSANLTFFEGPHVGQRTLADAVVSGSRSMPVFVAGPEPVTLRR